LARIKITVTVDPEIVSRIDELVKRQVYRNRSHAVEVALRLLLEKERFKTRM